MGHRGSRLAERVPVVPLVLGAGACTDDGGGGGEEVWRHDAAGGVNGWPAVVGDTIVWPVSGGDVSHLLALRLPG